MRKLDQEICTRKFSGISSDAELIYIQHDFIPMTWEPPKKPHTSYPLRALICSRCEVETQERIVTT